MSNRENGPDLSTRQKRWFYSGSVAFLAVLGFIGYKVGEVNNDAPKATVQRATRALAKAERQFAALGVERSCEYVVMRGVLTSRSYTLDTSALRNTLDDTCGYNQLHRGQADQATEGWGAVQAARDEVTRAEDKATYDDFEKFTFAVPGALAEATMLLALAGISFALTEDL